MYTFPLNIVYDRSKYIKTKTKTIKNPGRGRVFAPVGGFAFVFWRYFDMEKATDCVSYTGNRANVPAALRNQNLYSVALLRLPYVGLMFLLFRSIQRCLCGGALYSSLAPSSVMPSFVIAPILIMKFASDCLMSLFLSHIPVILKTV